LELQAQTKAIETSGAAIAEAQSYAQANKITYEAAVDETTLLEEAENISLDTELNGENKRRESELTYLESKYEIEASFDEAIAKVECNKFKAMMESIGPETLKTMALSADEIQVRLLQGLGLHSTLIMDGRKPLNLFQTASQMIHRIDDNAANKTSHYSNKLDTKLSSIVEHKENGLNNNNNDISLSTTSINNKNNNTSASTSSKNVQFKNVTNAVTKYNDSQRKVDFNEHENQQILNDDESDGF